MSAEANIELVRQWVDQVWNAFWPGGIANPLDSDARGRPFDDLRWSRFKGFSAAEMFTVLSEHVLPFLRGAHVPDVPTEARERHRAP